MANGSYTVPMQERAGSTGKRADNLEHEISAAPIAVLCSDLEVRGTAAVREVRCRANLISRKSTAASCSTF